MMKYNPDNATASDDWLSLDETERIEMVTAYHRRIKANLPNQRMHSIIHVIIENQLAEGLDVVIETLERLKNEGLNRHEAIHAIGSVLAEHLWKLLREKPKVSDPNESYYRRLRSLTASRWRKETI